MLVNLININKFYNGKQILKNINLCNHERDRIGLIGINGCGKTTLLRILTGKELPDRSTEKDGIVSMASKTSIGYLEQMSGLDGKSAVIEEMKDVFSHLDSVLERMKQLELQMKNDEFISEDVSEEYSKLAAYYEANDGYTSEVKIKTVLNGMGFSESDYNREISSFSGGEKTRLAIAKLLLEEPNLLILDEPTVGLDPKQMVEIRTLIKKLGKNHTVILSSHILSEIQAVCDRVVIINKGEIAADDTAGNLSKKISTDHRLILRIEGNKDEILYELRKIEGIKYVRADMEREPGVFEFELEAEEGIDLRREINKTVQKHGWPILMMNSSEMTLEDIFLKITMGEGVPDQLKKLQEARPYENESESGGNN